MSNELSPKYDIVVIGLGAVGSATVYQLSKSGKKVLGIDRFVPPHTMGSSHGETRITRLAVGEGEDYVALAKRSHQIWRQIEAESGAQLMTTTSGILMDSATQPWGKHGSEDFWERTVSFAKRQEVEHEILDAKSLRTRFPAFNLEPSGRAYLELEAGFLRPEHAIQAQLELAQKNGTELRFNSPVASVSKSGDEILVSTEKEEILAKRVLISAGGWISDFLTNAAKPRFRVCRQVLHWLEIAPGEIDWAKYPVWMWGFGPNPEDFIYGFPSLDGHTVKMASESFIDDVHPDFLNRSVSQEEQEVFWKEKVAGKILGLKRSFVQSVVCFYTVTKDARFVIEPLDGLKNVLIVSACSGHGFKHSAALGEQLAKELTEG
jgi:sarcosine oxidase